jgi:hypothetical protein
MKQIIAVIVLSVVSVKCAFAQHPSRDDFAPVQAHQAEMSLACGAAMTNILKNIADVAPEYQPLSEIGSVSIKSWGSTDAPTYYFVYRKNARLVFPSPPTNVAQSSGVDRILMYTNNLRPNDYTLVIDSGGMDLEISICDAENSRSLKADGKYYSLLKVNEWDKFYLNYKVTFHTIDARLEKPLNGIVETNITLLRSNLRKILGVNPEKKWVIP